MISGTFNCLTHFHGHKLTLSFLHSLENVGLKFKYQFNEVPNEVKALQSDDTLEPTSKKIKLKNDSKKSAITDYSFLQLPVTRFIIYLENQKLTTYLEKCQALYDSRSKSAN